MFDKHYNSRTDYIPYEKSVTINRAPTDESIKLYEEMKEKAYNSILDSFQINNNILNVCGYIYDDYISFKRNCRYIVNLNGKEIKGQIKVDRLSGNVDKFEIYKQIVSEVSKEIAVALVVDIAQERFHDF